MIVVAGTEEDGDAVDVERGAETARDGFEEGCDFGEVSGFVGEFGEKLLGGVGLAEEALVDPLLKTLGEDKAEGDEDCDAAEDADQVAALMVRVPEEIVEGEGHPNGKQNSQDCERSAGEGVASSLADNDAEIHGTLNDDDVGEGERKEKKDEEDCEVDPFG